jgi:DNA-binding Xre family transcriptional regulator
MRLFLSSTHIQVNISARLGMMVIIYKNDWKMLVTYSEILIMRITTLCKQRGITYNKLAVMCGLNQSTVDNIVRGVSGNPRIQTIHRIAIGLNMTLAEFLDYKHLNEYSFDE